MISKLFCGKTADMNSLYKLWYHRMEKIAISIFVKILNQIGRDGPYAGPPFTIMSGSTALQSREKNCFKIDRRSISIDSLMRIVSCER